MLTSLLSKELFMDLAELLKELFGPGDSCRFLRLMRVGDKLLFSRRRGDEGETLTRSFRLTRTGDEGRDVRSPRLTRSRSPRRAVRKSSGPLLDLDTLVPDPPRFDDRSPARSPALSAPLDFTSDVFARLKLGWELVPC